MGLGNFALSEGEAAFGFQNGVMVAEFAVFEGLDFVGVDLVFASLRFEPILLAEAQAAETD
jgi:hypothetical protein